LLDRRPKGVAHDQAELLFRFVCQYAVERGAEIINYTAEYTAARARRKPLITRWLVFRVNDADDTKGR
jgi:hypothetical protein